jgi:hypothetical protein
VERGQAAARRRSRPRLPTDLGPTNLSDRLPYWVLTATAVAVVPVTRRLDRPAYPGPDVGARPAATHVGSEPMHRQLSAASPGEPVGRPAVASGSGSGVARCRRDAAPLPSCGLESGPEVWRGIRRLLNPTRGTSPSRQRDQVLVLHSPRLPGNRSAPVLPLHSAFGMRSSARQRLRGLPASVPYGTASVHRHPARVWHPERH